MRCSTTSGHYRCTKDAGHAGDCEADSPAYADTVPAPSLESRVATLEAQVRSLQLAAPRGIE